MKNIFLTSIFAIACLAFVTGCTPAEEGTDAAETETSSSADPAAPSDTASAEMGSCEGCSMEVAKTSLVSVDGKDMCSKCSGM